MKHHEGIQLCFALAAAFLAGCATNQGSNESLDTMRYGIESTGKFVHLDQTTQDSVKCTGLQERILPDGRLEVVANVKNQEKRLIRVQIDCIFEDEQGGAAEDQNHIPSQNLVLPGLSTEAVQFTSANNQARRYTIRVREAR